MKKSNILLSIITYLNISIMHMHSSLAFPPYECKASEGLLAELAHKIVSGKMKALDPSIRALKSSTDNSPHACLGTAVKNILEKKERENPSSRYNTDLDYYRSLNLAPGIFPFMFMVVVRNSIQEGISNIELATQMVGPFISCSIISLMLYNHRKRYYPVNLLQANYELNKRVEQGCSELFENLYKNFSQIAHDNTQNIKTFILIYKRSGILPLDTEFITYLKGFFPLADTRAGRLAIMGLRQLCTLNNR